VDQGRRKNYKSFQDFRDDIVRNYVSRIKHISNEIAHSESSSDQRSS
jgi:hypothetical protein